MAPSGATPLFPCEVGPPCLSMSFACSTGEIFVQHQIKSIFLFSLCTGLSTFYYIAANYRAGGKCTPHSLSPPPLHPQASLPFTRAAKSPHCMHTTLQNAANSRIPHLLCPACARHYTAPVENWWQTARQANIPPPKHSGCNRLALIFIALDDREK